MSKIFPQKFSCHASQLTISITLLKITQKFTDFCLWENLLILAKQNIAGRYFGMNAHIIHMSIHAKNSCWFFLLLRVYLVKMNEQKSLGVFFFFFFFFMDTNMTLMSIHAKTQFHGSIHLAHGYIYWKLLYFINPDKIKRTRQSFKYSC